MTQFQRVNSIPDRFSETQVLTDRKIKCRASIAAKLNGCIAWLRRVVCSLRPFWRAFPGLRRPGSGKILDKRYRLHGSRMSRAIILVVCARVSDFQSDGAGV